MRALLSFISCALLVSVLLATEARAQTAPPGNVLFITINGGYNPDGDAAFAQLVGYVGAANATHLVLSSNGQVATHLQTNSYQQIWTYDLSASADSYPLDVAAIASWYASHPTKHVICDGRFLSSFYLGRGPTEGRQLVQNYFYNLATRAGGLMLGTDHNDYANGFTNPLAQAIGIGPFTGNFGGNFPLDQNHPVATIPNVIAELHNDTTTGQAPFGLQPNGKVLHTFGYHSGNVATPGISSTIDGSLSVRVTLDAPSDGAVLCDEEDLLLQSTVTNGTAPFTFRWTSSVDGELATTEDASVPIAALTPGTHVLTVLVTDTQGRVDNDSVTITLGGSACLDACGAGTEVCLSEDDDGTLFTIGLVGPTGPAYAVCRVVPAGFGSNPAALRVLDCEDGDNDGFVDPYTPAQIVARFGAGYCGQ